MHRYLVFDLDGTLVDSLPGIAEGVARALGEQGLAIPTPDEVRGMIGQGARRLCAQALGYATEQETPPELLERTYALFCKHYPQCWQGDYTRPYPGMLALLHTLHASGVRMAVLSNKPHDVTLPMVRELFSAIPFDPIMGYTGRFPRKPAPDALLHIAEAWQVAVGEVTLVGDSPFDARTAQAAGSGFVAVSWGYAAAEAMVPYSNSMAHSVEQLAALLR